MGVRGGDCWVGSLFFLGQWMLCSGDESHGRDVRSPVVGGDAFPEVSAGLFPIIGIFALEEGLDRYRDGGSDLRDTGSGGDPDIIESSVSAGPVEERGVVGEKSYDVARGLSLEGLFMKVGATIDPGFRRQRFEGDGVGNPVIESGGFDLVLLVLPLELNLFEFP